MNHCVENKIETENRIGYKGRVARTSYNQFVNKVTRIVTRTSFNQFPM